MLSKCKDYFFHRSHDIENKLLIIIHADKMSVQKKTSFSETKPRAFSRPFTLKTYKNRKSPHDILSPKIKLLNIQDQYFNIYSGQILRQTEKDRNKRIVFNNHYLFKSQTKHT